MLAIKLYEQGIKTLIPWVGLPGTMGGATIGNAGCFGLEMTDIFVQAEVLDIKTGEVIVYQKDDIHYEYRESILKNNPRFFIISTLIDLVPRGGIYESMTPEDLRALRKSKQPTGFSCGSFFKNPIGTSAGKLIDDAGLKGTRVGGVKVSLEHANFFINDEKATWHDVVALRDIVKKAVYEKYGIELEEEVRIISSR